MSAANEVREKLAYSLLTISTLLLLFGIFTSTGWSFFALIMGSGMFMMGGIMFSSLSLINGVPWLTKLFSKHLEPVWDGEILYTDGSAFKIRYDFDHKGSAWFVVSDVCMAIGMKPPKKDDLKCGGIPVLEFGGLASFSEENVLAYLTQFAIRNHEASRLLVNVRNNVLRKLEKQKDDEKRYG